MEDLVRKYGHFKLDANLQNDNETDDDDDTKYECEQSCA